MQNDKKIYLKDYKPSDYLIDEVFLEFDINNDVTVVKSTLKMRCNEKVVNPSSSLVLDGEKLILRKVELNGNTLSEKDYLVTEDNLTLYNVPSNFTLNIEVAIEPQNNTALYGLYKSNGNYCTQCEPRGFSHITYFLDRPDILTRVTTKIIADKSEYPTLLSNGNLIEQGELSHNRHFVIWQDPSLKSIYLFALVAGDFACIIDEFITLSKRKIQLKIYTEKNYINQCAYAMASLKQAMKWDEDNFGREYDLDIYMIVAISDFNMGAMENKGLNIFNSKYILATKETATDFDFVHIATVIAHEYFHNWRGNRVTVRDWFQLSLKEGFTVFTDQEFTADLYARSLKRIEDVTLMKTAQFTEDSSPLSHPVRPNSYVEINNFYTLTVYDKGAEIVRMLRNMVGEKTFKKATDLFFQNFDGKAATIEDFLHCMTSVSNIDFTQFKNWYDYEGTPIVDVESEYKEEEKKFYLTIKQKLPKYPNIALNFPFALGLLDKNGNDLLAISENKIFYSQQSEITAKRMRDERYSVETPRRGVSTFNDAGNLSAKSINITKQEETFVFDNIEECPVPSLLCNFSAPVKVNYKYTNDELLFLLQHDNDAYNRWNAGRELMVKIILGSLQKYNEHAESIIDELLIKAFANILLDNDLDFGLKAELLNLPSEEYLYEFMPIIDVDGIYMVVKQYKKAIAVKLKNKLFAAYNECVEHEYVVDAKAIGKRKLKNLMLDYLMVLEDKEIFDLAKNQYFNALNMTDGYSSFVALVCSAYSQKQDIIADFYAKWQCFPLVIDKWFSAQAMVIDNDALEKIRNLTLHQDFNINNPNRVRALLTSFSKFNSVNFHRIDGAGYRFLKDMIMKIDPLNPQLSAFLVKSLINWKRFGEVRGWLMLKELHDIADKASISKNLREVVEKSFGNS